MGFPFARRGLTVEAAASYFLPRIVGQGRALDYCLTGRLFAAREEPALFTQVVPTGKALERARAIAQDLAANCSLVSLALVKASLTANPQHPLDAHAIESRFIASCFAGRELPEGFASFLEKRSPHFPGLAKDAEFATIDMYTKAREPLATRRAKL